MTPYYQDDHVTIYHGDCREVLPLLGGINLTVTSPPYNTMGTRIPARPSGMHSSNGWLAKATAIGYADDLTEPDYEAWQVDVAAAIHDATVDGGSFFYNHKIRYRDTNPVHPIDLVRQFADWHLRQELVWDRGGSMVLNARMFPPSDERIYWMTKGAWRWNQDAVAFMSVWRITPTAGDDGHPCPYPADIPKRCMVATTSPGDTVLDPFMGSGTTLRAAKDLGRKAIGIEISERYCEIAARRMGQEVLAF